MPRSIWKGAISFGLVNIPVALYPAESRGGLHFNQLDRRTLTRVREQRVNEETGEEVSWDDVVKGYDTGDGTYVVLSESDFRQANPRRTQSIDILSFVDGVQIDPAYFDKPYYLAPVGSGRKGYALLRAVLRRTGRVAIAKVVIRTKEYLAAVMPRGEVMVLEVLRYAHELRDPAELDVPGDDLEALGVKEPEVKMAEQLVEAMVEEWQPGKYHDEYRDDLLELIHEKAETGHAGGVKAERQPAGEGKVVDIMALLRKSVEEARVQESGDEGAATGTEGRAARAPAGSGPRRRGRSR